LGQAWKRIGGTRNPSHIGWGEFGGHQSEGDGKDNSKAKRSFHGGCMGVIGTALFQGVVSGRYFEAYVERTENMLKS
jgi:hypothetical protein